MSNSTDERWLSRQELADRLRLPVKTLAQWASKGTGPRYARMGRHVRYRLSDVIEWEAARVSDRCETAARAPTRRDYEEVAPLPPRDAKTGGAGRSVR
jgi:excisionase family DNA binding protein